ncbi:UNVERIFIED_CONTAM: Small ubiquitin-related modifier 1 [Sesamum calycinum]|uniref:Small ubiquitin-related modifier 1 n=1 Tax=Sesamum calycinum TaxID=2727403 RepID=A0AAW2Q3K0_9LAMI
MSSVEDDKKPADSSAHINLKVKGQGFSSAFLFYYKIFLFLRLFGWCRHYNRGGAWLKLIFVVPVFSALLFDDGNEVFFRIKRSTQLKKLMNAYCDRQSVDFNSIAFLFDGRRLRGEQTPDELEMEDGDEIDAMLHQTGGATA